MTKNNCFKRNLFFIIFFISLLIIDQISKYLATKLLGVGGEYQLIPGVFHLTYLRNEGAAWGVLQGYFPLFTIITILAIFGLMFYYLKMPQIKKYNLLRFTVVLIAAGAVGNFIDRLIFRYVVDFFYFKLINFPVFNMADSYVSISAVLLAYCFLIRYKDEDLLWKKK